MLYIHNKLTDTRGHPGYRYHVQRRSGRVVISLSGDRVRAVFYSNGLVIRRFDSGLNVVSSTRLIFLLCNFFLFFFFVFSAIRILPLAPMCQKSFSLENYFPKP